MIITMPTAKRANINIGTHFGDEVSTFTGVRETPEGPSIISPGLPEPELPGFVPFGVTRLLCLS